MPIVEEPTELEKKHTKEFLDEYARFTQEFIEEFFGIDGFFILMFDRENVGFANYISNCTRETMIEALRECADRLEKNKDDHFTRLVKEE